MWWTFPGDRDLSDEAPRCKAGGYVGRWNTQMEAERARGRRTKFSRSSPKGPSASSASMTLSSAKTRALIHVEANMSFTTSGLIERAVSSAKKTTSPHVLMTSSFATSGLIERAVPTLCCLEAGGVRRRTMGRRTMEGGDGATNDSQTGQEESMRETARHISAAAIIVMGIPSRGSPMRACSLWPASKDWSQEGLTEV